MATTAGSRPTPPSSRRSTPSSHSSPSNSIIKGATARSAASHRASSSLQVLSPRRASLKSGTPPPAETRETLAASLRHETEHKEQLLVQLQNKEQTIATLTAENDQLNSALNAVETRINELYADQSRMEEEMAARIDVTEKLRSQVRELEKEKRDVQRRYNEQTATFDAERQSFYDNEQHLKSRIQSLTQSRRMPEPHLNNAELESEMEQDDDGDPHPPTLQPIQTVSPDLNDPEMEPAEMTSLKLELSTLSTSYSSLQSTLILLQTQLVDLKRVNHELQEENESYMILLREKTLSGQFDVLKQVGGSPSMSENGGADDDSDDGLDDNADRTSLRSTGRSTLDRVEEEATEDSVERQLERSLEPRDTDSPVGHHTRHLARHGRKRTTSTSRSSSDAPLGESLADLPITGPGLDLAAELGRAENKDILDGNTIDDRPAPATKSKRGKKSSDPRKVSISDSSHGIESSGSVGDIDALRNEVKSLKDANKALSLYASKIIDRIIAQEGFEHVLSADYDKQPGTPSTPAPSGPKSPPLALPNLFGSKTAAAKPRPQSLLFPRSVSNPAPVPNPDKRVNTAATSSPLEPNTTPTPRVSRRSLSFDWKTFSPFGGDKKVENANLRPLTLKPGTTSVTGARKLDTPEDEEDRRERERLNATMKLLGIEPTSTPLLHDASPTVDTPPLQSSTPSARFSFFRSRSGTSESSSIHSTTPSHNNPVGLGYTDQPPSLTQEALQQAEAVNSLAVLDARERDMSAEIAKGASGGFTEIAPRRAGEGRRSRRSEMSGGGSGSGSTVWSAGMSGEGLDGED